MQERLDSTEGEESEPVRKGHALFPRAPGTGPETRDIAYVMIERINDRGTREVSPRDFPAEELPDLEVVFDLFGGGDYKFAAKNSDHEITAWYPPAGVTRLHVEGRSKPFRQQSVYERAEQAPAPAPPAATPAPAVHTPDYQAFFLAAEARAQAAQERADRLLLELITVLRTPASAPIAPPVAPPSNGVAQLVELAGVLKTLQGGGGGGGGLRQLAETVDVLDKIRGPAAAAAPAAAPDDMAQITQLFTQITGFAGKDMAHNDDEKPTKKAAAPLPAGHLVWIEGLGWVVRPADQPPAPAQRPVLLASSPAPAPVAIPAPVVAASSTPVAAPAAPPPVATPAPVVVASSVDPSSRVDELAASFLSDPAFRDAFLAKVNQALPPVAVPAPKPSTPEAPAPSNKTPPAALEFEELPTLDETRLSRAARDEFEADPEVHRVLPGPLLAMVKEGLGAAA